MNQHLLERQYPRKMQMLTPDSLDGSIQLYSLDLNTKCKIINNLWGLDVDSTNFYNNDFNFDAYFEYYHEQCSLALHDAGRHIWIRTHRHIIEVAKHLKDQLTRDEVKEILRPNLPVRLVPKPGIDDELLDSSINLAARLLLMMEFGNLQFGFSGLTGLVWKNDKALVDCIKEHFQVSRSLVQERRDGLLEEFFKDYFLVSRSGQESISLERKFNARNLGRIAGIQIAWTKNIADHLRLIDDENKVLIFHYASFLELQRNSQMFPEGLIEETLQTIKLFFPRTDKKVKRWFAKESFKRIMDTRAIKCGRLKTEDRQIGKFRFWHDRLVVLKQFYDEAEPSTLPQWWCDRRKRVQWYTFWVALLVLVLTVFFGVVQSVKGGLQVYKAYHPLL